LIGSFRQYHTLLIVLVTASLVLLCFILISLYTQPIYIWDEAIYANNSLDMAQSHQYLVYTVNGVPDHYNTKPPLVIWLQSLSFRLFSYTEFALRLPTLLALVGVLFLFFVWIKKWGLSIGIGIVATFILLTTKGAIRPHVFLSGDLDGVLVFFTSAITFIHLEQILKKEISNRSIVLFFVCLLGGFFTKSVAVLLLAPSIFISYVYAGMLGKLLKNKTLYLCFIVFILIVSGYYFLREKYDLGYINIVWNSEFKRYTSNVMTWHAQPFLFYFKNIITRFNTFYFILTILLALPYFVLNTTHKKMVVHLFLICIVYLIVISIPAVKLEWYDAPIYPLWSFALAIMICELCLKFYEERNQLPVFKILFTPLILILAAWPFYSICKDELLATRVYQPQEMEAMMLKEVDRKYDLPNYIVLMDVEDNKLHHFDALNFYINSFHINNRKTVLLKRFISDIQLHDTLVVVQQKKIDSLQSRFTLESIDDNNKIYVIVFDKK